MRVAGVTCILNENPLFYLQIIDMAVSCPVKNSPVKSKSKTHAYLDTKIHVSVDLTA